jgi:hypothetical protein
VRAPELAPAPGDAPAFERLHGLRVVADPVALDAARWTGDGVIVLRIAPDDTFAIDATGVAVADGHAIVEPEAGISGAWVELDAVRRHVEWALPSERPALGQGNVATVPAKVWLPADDRGDGSSLVLLVTAAAYADELAGRLR